MVPSTPARMLYRAFHWSVVCAARACVTASWTSRGRKDSWRPERDERVHRPLAGQAWQVAAANLTTIASVPLWRHGLHTMLVAPYGQVTCWCSQSMVNAPAVYPSARACGEVPASRGPIGLAMPALMGFAMSSATPSDAGLVSGLFATGAQLGGALGLAILAALATVRTNALRAGGQATASALTGGYHLASGVSAAIAGAGILLASTVLRPPARPTATTEDPYDVPASIQTEGEG